jgi:hypothetical protein
LRTPFYGAAACLRFHAAKTPSRHRWRGSMAAQQLAAGVCAII